MPLLKRFLNKFLTIAYIVGNLLWYLFLISVCLMVLSGIIALVFMGIEYFTGYSTPFMAAFVDFEARTSRNALEMYASS